jgi:hypothetical protein
MGEIEDKAAILEVITAYATGIDFKDDELLRSCFSEDCVADYGDVGVFRSPDEVMAFMSESHKAMPQTYHRMTNTVTTLHGEVADSRTYFHGLMDLGGGAWIDVFGHYDDEFVRTEAGWKIRHRRAIISRQAFTAPPEPAA